MEVITFSFKNKKINAAKFTEQWIFEEIVIFVLGEQLILGPTYKYEIRAELFTYITACLDQLDLHAVETIIREIELRVEELAFTQAYRSLLYGGEIFLKYDYQLGNRFSKLNVYSDAANDFN